MIFITVTARKRYYMSCRSHKSEGFSANFVLRHHFSATTGLYHSPNFADFDIFGEDEVFIGDFHTYFYLPHIT